MLTTNIPIIQVFSILLRYILMSFVWTKVLSSCVSSDSDRINMCPHHDFDGLVVSSLYLLWSKTDRDLVNQCAADCNRDQRCQAFFYNRLTLVCQGHSNSSLTIADAVPESGWVHYRYCLQRDCADVLPFCRSNGIFTVAPSDGLGNIRVFCDMQTDGGGWLVFQRRKDGLVDFLREWADYKSGFGLLTDEFWLGNDYINRLTSQKAYTLRVDLGDFDNGTCASEYSNFNVASEADLYNLTVGPYSGYCGDDLWYHSGSAFATTDRDNRNCAVRFEGGWWFKTCHRCHLNGIYNQTGFAKGISWRKWKGDYYSLRFSEMKFRPS